MYNFWYLFFACIPILIVGIVLWVCSKRYSWFSNKGTTLEMSGIVTTFIAIVFLVIFILLAVVPPLCAKQEYIEFVNTKEMVELVYEDDGSIENAGLTSKIIEVNNWLAKARASKETYGDWSMYYYLDLNELDYIQLNV